MDGGKKPDRPGQAVPDQIRKDAPRPVLRPNGPWRSLANEVDRKVREQEDAAKAKRKWAARIADDLKNKESRSRKLGMRFRRSSDGE